jgi:crotonobetainyl-CoA:carnitine CoA-transferase CaiB-like acyl-CoA transferase
VSRLARFADYRFIGLRDTMRVYDSDDDDQFALLQERVTEEDLVERKLVQAFAPDTLDEARNRGFKQVRVPTTSV